LADYTGSPEILDGRVKTLHPKVHGGLLAARGNEKHEKEMGDHKIRGIDLVIVNLYPFAQAVAKGGDFATCIENIDIGGPAMIRASAKNNASVTICTSPGQYEGLVKQMDSNDGCTTFDFRKNLATALPPQGCWLGFQSRSEAPGPCQCARSLHRGRHAPY